MTAAVDAVVSCLDSPAVRKASELRRSSVRVTLSAIKADVGSIGGHTRPTERMMAEVKGRVQREIGRLLIDGMVTYTGDDIALIMSHTHGTGADAVHQFAWDCFLAATAIGRGTGLKPA